MAERQIQFLFGTHVYRFPSLPLAELKRDIRTMQRLGFNTIKVQESWSADERRPGEVDFGEIEELLVEAQSAGLKVYLGVTMEQAPAWLWKRYPDAYMVNGLGQPHLDPTQYLLPADGKPGPCWHHPGVREAATRFMATLAARLGRFDNIVVWNVWQEFGFWPAQPGASELAETLYCYCPHTLARFREWLREKY